MTAWYNEIEPYAAQWLRNLIAAGLLPAGEVDDRSITDVRPADLIGFTQCHFFAGLGGWPYALKLAGWSDARPVWTGSCPCQPFSTAGKGKAGDDERHLWPAWSSLIAECRPPVVFGEQVEAAIGWGWLDLVFADLEAAGYVCGATVLPACSVGAPHIRQRLWFVADSGRERREGERLQLRPGQPRHAVPEAWRSGEADGLADAGLFPFAASPMEAGGRLVEAEQGVEEYRSAVGLGNAESGERQPRLPGESMRRPGTPGGPGAWSDPEWLPCRDGKARPAEPGIFPLAHGVPARVPKLRAIGNAIVPQVAAEFVAAFMECCP